MYCRNCGEEVQETAEYCSSCGEELESTAGTTASKKQAEDDISHTENDNNPVSRIFKSGSILDKYSVSALTATVGSVLIVVSLFFTYQQASALGTDFQGAGLEVASGEDILILVVFAVIVVLLSRYRWNSRMASLCAVLSILPLILFSSLWAGRNIPSPETRALVNPGFGLYLLGLGSVLVLISSGHRVVSGLWQYIQSKTDRSPTE